MNNRDHDQKYYLSYEDGETHFWVNDDIKSQLSYPIGGIIAFPIEINPSRNSDNWLECNGQSFDTSKYPELYKLLGSNKVPNYQGMFLRGYGSQNYSQNNGENVGVTSTKYSSGLIGKVQGDATRNVKGVFDNGPIDTNFNESQWGRNGSGTKSAKNWDWYTKSGVFISSPFSYRSSSGNDSPGFWTEYLTHYRYTLSGDAESGYTLTETPEVTSSILYNMGAVHVNMDNALVVPIANEIRPVNVAVKYWIRSR